MDPHVSITQLQQVWTLGQSCFIDQVLFDLWGPPSWSGNSWRFLEEGSGVGRSGNHEVKSLSSWKSVNCHPLEFPLMVHYSSGY